MRNVAVVGQALPPIEFPYPQASYGLWALRRKDYKERMEIISKWTVQEYKKMLEYDTKAASSGSRTIHPTPQATPQSQQ